MPSRMDDGQVIWAIKLVMFKARQCVFPRVSAVFVAVLLSF